MPGYLPTPRSGGRLSPSVAVYLYWRLGRCLSTDINSLSVVVLREFPLRIRSRTLFKILLRSLKAWSPRKSLEMSSRTPSAVVSACLHLNENLVVKISNTHSKQRPNLSLDGVDLRSVPPHFQKNVRDILLAPVSEVV